jgi:hypothetical protein|tara:strand:- start:143 stop:982 length:840 start_codon:yes stop_codon:yes gene_type:complete
VNLIVPKVITGGSLESLFYAYMNEIPIIITQPYIPFELEKVDFLDCYEMLGYNNTTTLTKIQVWDRMVFILSMAGLVMMPNNIRNVRTERNKIIFSLNDNSRFTVMYERKISFDQHNEDTVKVYDWFDIKSGSVVEIDALHDNENTLVHDVLFYDSKRIGNKGRGRKDLVSISTVSQKEILEYENSENNVRMKTIHMMKDAGLRGKANGYNKYGKQLFYAIDLEHTHREAIKQYTPKYTIQEIFNLARKDKNIWKLTKKLLHHKQISILRESSRLQVVV